MKDKQESRCLCVESMWAVFADMQQAYDRIRNVPSDLNVQQWLQGFIDGVNGCADRFKVTQSKCCCQRMETNRKSL